MIPGKVTSVVRVVPTKESSGGIGLSVSPIEDKQGLAGGPPKPPTITLRDGSGKERAFKPDVALPKSSTQADVFERCGRQLADAMLSSSESGVGEDKGCDGVVLCYGGHGMGKRHTLYETSTSSRFRDFEDDWEWSYAKAMQGRGRGKNETGLIVRIVHEIFRRKAWTKFRKEKVDHGSPGSGSLVGTPSSGAHSPATSPPPSQAELRRNINMSDLELQCSSFAVTHTGLVLDLLQEKASSSAGTPASTGKYGAPQGEEDYGHRDLLKTPNLQRTLAVADDRQRRKEGMDHVTWETCTNTVDFESSLKPAIALCVKHEKAHLEQSGKEHEAEQLTSKEWMARRKERPQFVVTQVRLVRRRPGVDISAPGAAFVSKIAFVLVLPGETRSTEGPVLIGTHLSASMLRLRAVLDALTGVGGQESSAPESQRLPCHHAERPLGIHEAPHRPGNFERRGPDFKCEVRCEGGIPQRACNSLEDREFLFRSSPLCVPPWVRLPTAFPGQRGRRLSQLCGAGQDGKTTPRCGQLGTPGKVKDFLPSPTFLQEARRRSRHVVILHPPTRGRQRQAARDRPSARAPTPSLPHGHPSPRSFNRIDSGGIQGWVWRLGGNRKSLCCRSRGHATLCPRRVQACMACRVSGHF